jgi:hypothetical protein
VVGVAKIVSHGVSFFSYSGAGISTF